MDATESDFDIKLQKISGDLIQEFDKSLPTLLRRPEESSTKDGGSRVRSHVRARELDWLTGTLLDPFQELPQLLDPHLPRWIPFLAEAFLEHLLHPSRGRRSAVSSRRAPSKLLVPVGQAICRMLYTFCKVRGDKVIVHFLNVETRYLELLLTALEEAEVASSPSAADSQDNDDAHQQQQQQQWMWEQRYIVLLWLSHLLLAPFDLSTISSVDLQESAMERIPGLSLPENLPGITLRVIPLAIKYLASPGKERDGAKALLARIAMRRDMQQLGLLKSLVQWSLSSLSRPQSDETVTVYYYLGILSFLAAILRSSSHTSDMEPYLAPIFHAVYGMSQDSSPVSKTITSFALARKMILKVVRSVIVTLLRHPAQDMTSTELTENAISYLLESLSDNDTPVRLAASKSLSIITLKLDNDMASQVVEAVLESLNRNVLWKKSRDGTPAMRDLAAVDALEWHGLMLTLAHLLYRRSPPQEQLSDIVHALLLGLSFEQRSTAGTSVGANVRDAACFGVWALARRYSSKELLAVPTESVFAAKAHPEASSILQVLGTELTTCACLDSAGNIRRGASAALQELIGRHPDTVEKGIWVVQTVDYHAVARRSRAVETVALGVAKLSDQYGHAIIDGILGWRGIGDPDAASRRAAGASYGVLTAELATGADGRGFSHLDASARQLIAKIRGLEKRQVEERHGLLLCLAATLEQAPKLLSTTESGTLDAAVEASVDHILSEIPLLLASLQATSSRRSELLAEAGGRLVVSLSPLLQAKMFGTQDLIPCSRLYSPGASSSYLDFASNTPSTVTRHASVEAFMSQLKDILPIWLARNEADVIGPASCAALTVLIFSSPEDRKTTLESWAGAIRNRPTSRTASRGDGYFHALASAQPLAHPVHDSDVACDALLQRWAADTDVETRVAILQSLTRSNILVDKPLVFLGLLSDGLNDYTTTARGDIGSLVRMQALRAVKVLWQRGGQGSEGGAPWFEQSITALFYSTLRLSAEKLDRVRPEAQAAISLLMDGGSAARFTSFTFSSQEYFQTLLSLVHADCLVPVLRTLAQTDRDAWMANLLSGFVTSADTGNEDLVIASRATLTNFCDASADDLDLVCGALLHNLKRHQGEDRIVVPTLEMAAFLFHVGVFQRSRGVSLRGLCLQAQKASYKTGNVRKIEACVRVYGGVARSGAGKGDTGVQEARKRLGALLLHPWPKVRTTVVDEVWNCTGDEESARDKLLRVDWGIAQKADIKAIVHELRLE